MTGLWAQLLREIADWTARAGTQPQADEAANGGELALDLRRTGWLFALLQGTESLAPRAEREGLRWAMQLTQAAARHAHPTMRFLFAGLDSANLSARADPALARELAAALLDLALDGGPLVAVTWTLDAQHCHCLLEADARQVRLFWPADWLETTSPKES